MANSNPITRDLNPVNLDLRDIHLPDPVSWWPPAPGWWIVAGLVFVAVIGLWIVIKRYQSHALQRTIRRELEAIKERFYDTGNQYELVQSLSVLLRRACISFYPRHQTASLTGEDWLLYLDKTMPNNISTKIFQFYEGVGNIIASAPYMSQNSNIYINENALITLCESWLMAQPVKLPESKVI